MEESDWCVPTLGRRRRGRARVIGLEEPVRGPGVAVEGRVEAEEVEVRLEQYEPVLGRRRGPSRRSGRGRRSWRRRSRCPGRRRTRGGGDASGTRADSHSPSDAPIEKPEHADGPAGGGRHARRVWRLDRTRWASSLGSASSRRASASSWCRRCVRRTGPALAPRTPRRPAGRTPRGERLEPPPRVQDEDPGSRSRREGPGSRCRRVADPPGR